LVAAIVAGAVFVNGSVTPPEGFNSMFILVLADIGVTKNVISTWSPGFNEVTFVVPIFVVKKFVEVLVLCMRVTGGAFSVEKTICNFVKSSAGLQGARPRVNLISSIPSAGTDEIP